MRRCSRDLMSLGLSDGRLGCATLSRSEAWLAPRDMAGYGSPGSYDAAPALPATYFEC